MRWHPFQVTRNNEPIGSYPLKNAVNTGLSWSNAYSEIDAVIAAGLSLEKYLKGEYDVRTIEYAIAWHATSRQIQSHQNDAVSIEQEKIRKRASKRR